jgi:ABC-type sugar transport system substrate-binding protein
MAFGAVEALSDAGLSIPIIGFDALPEALIAINGGQMTATVEQFPGGQAAGALDIIVAKLRDGKDPAQHDTFLTPIIISKDNLADAERAVEAGVAPAASPSPTS